MKDLKEVSYVDRFDDIKILQYTFDEFNHLPVNTKILIYCLSRASLAGRDIIYDQNYKYNLLIRNSLEQLFVQYTGDCQAEEFTKFSNYLKRIWFSNGIHDPFSKEKIQPAFSKEFFHDLIDTSFSNNLPEYFQSIEDAKQQLTSLVFDPDIAPRGVEQDANKDIIRNSAVNFYEGVTQKESEEFYAQQQKEHPYLSCGLNTKLEKQDQQIVEKKWKSGGMYSAAIQQIIYWLKEALKYTENEQQRQWLEALVSYYETGDLEAFNNYNISWLQDTQSHVDLINGFIETYSDPLGLKGTWESILHVKDTEATTRTKLLSQNAQWFEDHAPIEQRFKKEKVKGISATVVNVAILGGESYPTSPIGVNLPNSDWIRKEYGSKSITLNNITKAHHEAMIQSGLIEEFAYSEEEIERHKKYGFVANNLHTDLHECLGHGSGKMLDGVNSEALKNYQAPVEEARADLFALYFMMDQKLIDLGIMESLEVARAQYSSYIRNGLFTQLVKIKPGKNLEQAHMRNRQLIASWCYEKGKDEYVIEKKTEGNKTYFVINDHQKLRELFAQLLSEIQRIKSEGDYNAARELVENYGTKVPKELHQEALKRFNKLDIPPFTGFINPQYIPVIEKDRITDIHIHYAENYHEQMLNYSKNYSFLPVENVEL
jgi:dipeptidyl-peptidase-3